MAYVFFGIIGIFYAMILEAISKEFGKYYSLALALLLTAVTIVMNWAELLAVNFANGVGFTILFCSVVAAIHLVSSSEAKLKYPEYIVMCVGAISWAGFTQASRFLGHILGV